MRPQQPMFGPGWQPMATPTPRLWPKVAREVAILGVLALAALMSGVLASPRGWLAVLIARAVLGLLGNHRGGRDLGRTVVEWTAVAVLAFIVATAVPHAPKVKAPELRTPVQVEAHQADQLEGIRKSAAGIWERAAAGWSDFGKTKKETR